MVEKPAVEKFEKPESKKEAIPAAVREKHTIMDARTEAFVAYGLCVQKMARRSDEYYAEREIEFLRSAVARWYMYLRATFTKKHKVHTLGEYLSKNRRLPLDELFEYVKILDQQTYDLNITKIIKTKLDEKDTM